MCRKKFVFTVKQQFQNRALLAHVILTGKGHKNHVNSFWAKKGPENEKFSVFGLFPAVVRKDLQSCQVLQVLDICISYELHIGLYR